MSSADTTWNPKPTTWDEATWASLEARHRKMLCAVARNKLSYFHDKDGLSEEAVNEAWSVLHRKQTETYFETEKPFVQYMRITTRNTALQIRKREIKNIDGLDGAKDKALTRSDPAFRNTLDTLEHCIESLPPELRDLINRRCGRVVVEVDGNQPSTSGRTHRLLEKAYRLLKKCMKDNQ